MTRTLDTRHIRRWMLALLLALGCIAAVPQVHAQITGSLASDIAQIEAALSATIVAAGNSNSAATRVNMEETYRLWRQFRQKNIDSRPDDPQFAANTVKAEARLYAGSLLVDQEKLVDARTELEAAQVLIQGLASQPPEK